MTRTQKYIIGAIVALFGVVFFVFRPDVFIIANRPGVTRMLQNIVEPYGLGVFIVLFAFLLAKGFNTRWWVFILLFVLWEISYVAMFSFGSHFLADSVKLSPWFTKYKSVAMENRSMVQFQENTARYDKELFYTLKPGDSFFKSYEFNTKYHVNSLGVRDNEENLKYPEIIFLGDSFTMGWGVEEAEAFPNLVRNLSHKKVLNTGVSSYGTAREYRMLARTQTDSLKALVIQFHDTDLEENDYYIKNHKLGSRTEQNFLDQVEQNKRIVSYYPFKYLKTAWIQRLARLKTSKEAVGATSDAKLRGVYELYPNYLSDFYQILDEIKKIKNVPIIITYTGSFYTDAKVIEQFEAYAQKHSVSDVYFVNLGDTLNHSDYFYFDDHLNASGHKKVADLLFKKIDEVLTK